MALSDISTLRIGTRKSPLAMAQAQEVRDALVEMWPELNRQGRIELVPMATSGDLNTERSLSEIGGKGLFTKELEEALADGRIDMAVHSMKDMPTLLPDGMTIGCMLERENPCDMLIAEGISALDELAQGAVVGTSSLRRAAQLLMRRPDLRIVPLRGNVQTRLDKLKQGEVAATMLAKAGLNRLGLIDVPGVMLHVNEFLPAVAQGAIGVECRADNHKLLEMLSSIAHLDTEAAVMCERSFLGVLDGSCRTPIAGYADLEGNATHGRIRFTGLIAKPDGSAHHFVRLDAPARDAHLLGEEAGRQLLAKAGPDFLSA